jgi:membrane-associated phospholipid phosphatase
MIDPRNTRRYKLKGGVIIYAVLFFTNPVTAQVADRSVEEDQVILQTGKATGNTDTSQVYRMNYKRSIAFNVIATAANIYAIPNLIKSKKELTDAELQSLNPDALNGIERWALRQDPTRRQQIDVLSDRILTLTAVGAASLLLDKNIRQHWVRIITMYYETSAVTFSMYNFSPFGPLFQNKIRPFAYYTNFPADQRREGNSRNSFYSGHVANAAASTFFMVKVYSDYHPEIGGKKYLLYGLATLPPLLISYLRVKALFHFPSDCLVGLIIGAANGIIIPETHRIKNRNIQLGLTAAPGSAGVSMVWKFGNKYLQ